VASYDRRILSFRGAAPWIVAVAIAGATTAPR